jgi:mono/diheme cytochrome c family protein
METQQAALTGGKVMKRSGFSMIVVLMLAVLVLSACGGGNGAQQADERPAPPAEFAGMTNPFEGDAQAASAGQQLYEPNCASCHGSEGRGDGPAAGSLDPQPGDLRITAQQAGDDYIYWRIAKGGNFAPFNSSMPAWEGVLSDDQIWQLVTYINTFE